MPALSQYTYIFAITTIFAFLDAFNIGANDVANSFATSVSSRSLTMKQAMLIASVCEFSGSVAVGSRVADTIRKKIVDPQLFSDQPAVLLLTMMCAIIGSSTFLTVATRYGLPVSTTHSIIGGVVGAATAAVGIDKVNWGWDGVSQVFAAWIIAPGIAGVIGAFIFVATKVFILTKTNAVRKAFFSIPFYTFITLAAVTLLVSWKGIHVDPEPTWQQIVTIVFSVSGGVTILQAFFVLPYIWRKTMYDDWTLKWWMVYQGPWILKRPPPPPTPSGFRKPAIKDYYRGHLTSEELAYVRASESLLQSIQTAQHPPDLDKDDDMILPPPAQAPPQTPDVIPRRRSTGGDFIPPRPPGTWKNWRVVAWHFNRIILRGIEKDVIQMQKRNAVLNWDLEDMHARAPHYDNRAEYMYSALQIVTAAAASFTHGANDVANSIAPFATAYDIWQTGSVDIDGVAVHTWILAFGGIAIVMGLLIYGYHVMRNLGNRLTLISPSRGFCMELASALTVLLATKLSLPVSTTQCITGATVGVGLANGDWRCINPKLVVWIYLGWVVTVPVTGLIAGLLMGLILNGPRW